MTLGGLEYQNQSTLRQPRKQPNIDRNISDTPSTLCKLNTLRDYVSSHDHFPKGNWSDLKFTTNDLNEFTPDSCLFQHHTLQLDWLIPCAQKRNISRILLAGDSSNRNLQVSLVRQLSIFGYTCRDGKNDEMDENGIPIMTKDSYISKCAWFEERTFHCKPKTVELHQHQFIISWMRLLYWKGTDAPITVNEPSDGCPFINRTIPTLLDYMLHEYFQQIQPQLIVLSGTSHHDMGLDLSQYETVVKYLLEQTQDLVPVTTPVIIIPQVAWNLKFNKFKVSYLSERFEKRQYSRDEQSLRQNAALFKSVKAAIVQGAANIYPFLDMYSMSRQLMPLGYEDWIHLVPEFYDHIAAYILQLLCNSDTM